LLQTPQRETVLHIALRLGHVTAVQLVLDSPNFDVVKCDSLQTHKVWTDRPQFVVDVPVDRAVGERCAICYYQQMAHKI